MKKRKSFLGAVNLTASVLAAGLLIGLLTGLLTGCLQKANDIKPEMVKITVKGDENVTVNEPKSFEVTKGTKWSTVKEKIKVNYNEYYESAGWKLNGAGGNNLTDDYAFNEDKTVFALSKIKGISYKVEHWQQNIENNEYTKTATEYKPGKEGETTQAQAKNYEGFKAKDFTQENIKADSSTLIKIYYDRNIITLKLNLNGGTTTTQLEDGEGGTKLLKGKYGARVVLNDLKKDSDILKKWEPKLPKTFPASSPTETYTASWFAGNIITITGDDRMNIHSENTIKVGETEWNDILDQVKEKVSLKPEWQGGDYEIYEWRLDNENGNKLTDNYQITGSLTVYAVTNYVKFNIVENKIKLKSEKKGYTGDKPRGKIIIPQGITEIEDGQRWNEGAFSRCTEISSINFPQSLTKIGKYAFQDCSKLASLDLSRCTNLSRINDLAFSKCKDLTDLSLPKSLNTIGFGAFQYCSKLINITVDSDNQTYKSKENIIYTKDGKTLVLAGGGLNSVNLPNDLTTIGAAAFRGCESLTNIILPQSLKMIQGNAFENSGLTSIHLPANLTTMSENVFSDCKNLASLTVASGNTKFKAEDNILYTIDGKNLLSSAVAGLAPDLTISEGVTTIGYRAFSSCTNLTSIKFPSSLSKIRWGAFFRCTNLTSAVFTKTGGWAVYDDWECEDKEADIQQSDLANTATAAQYLKDTYCWSTWKRN